MSIRIETPQGENALMEFVLFHDRVYEYRSSRWPAIPPLDLANITGKSAFSKDRKMRPFIARDGNNMVARALAMVDARYNAHWNEPLGFIAMFEALPGTEAATAQLVEKACAWLGDQGMQAARAGSPGAPTFDFPFAIDNYDTLPYSFSRQNPPYYHALLKNAGFESERGWLDYQIQVQPEFEERWKSAIEKAQNNGYRIAPLEEVPESRRAPDFTCLMNDCFKSHWGTSPWTEEESAFVLSALGLGGALEASAIACRGNEQLGIVFAEPSDTSTVILKPGREIHDFEKLNYMVIGVREAARGQGIAMALASYAYLQLAKRGATHLAYPEVLDDNWASRQIGHKLGGTVSANWITYRRDFRH